MKSSRGPRNILLQPKAVIRRWVSRKVQPKAYAVARAYMRWKLPRIEKERKKAVKGAFETARRFALKNEDGPFPAVSTLFNIGLYLLIAERDIQAIKIDALTHPDGWTRKLHARVILLTIYEWDVDSVTGRSLREALDTVGAPEALRREAIDILRELRVLQRRVRKQFALVRNAAIAHRHPNALVQLRAIQDLRPEAVFSVAAEFYVQVDRFLHVLSQLLVLGSDFGSLVRQWSPKTQ